MSFIKSIQERYTTKAYNPNKKIEPKAIDELKEILRLSPSSINSQPWKFIFVSNPELKKKLAKVSNYNAEKIENCDTVVVFSRVEKVSDFEKDIANRLPKRTQDYYNHILKPLGEEYVKAWFGKQVYLALGVFLSACAEMKIDSTPMEGINNEEYDKILSAKGYKTEVAVAIGYRDAEDYNQLEKSPKVRKSFKEVIVEKN